MTEEPFDPMSLLVEALLGDDRRRVVVALTDGSADPASIAERVHLDERTVTDILAILCERGLVEKVRGAGSEESYRFTHRLSVTRRDERVIIDIRVDQSSQVQLKFDADPM